MIWALRITVAKRLFLLTLIMPRKFLILSVKELRYTEALLGTDLNCFSFLDFNVQNPYFLGHKKLINIILMMVVLSDIDGQEDMKRIYGIIAVEGKAKQEKGVKV